MERYLAELLIDELGKHKELVIKSNKEELLKILERLELKQNVFFEPIPLYTQTLEEGNVRYTLELRRILNNKLATRYHPSALTYLKGIARETNPKIIYSSDVICMKVARDKELVSILEQSGPFSVLAKQKEYQTNGVITKILLGVPGKMNDLRISCFEGANMSTRIITNEKSLSSTVPSKSP